MAAAIAFLLKAAIAFLLKNALDAASRTREYRSSDENMIFRLPTNLAAPRSIVILGLVPRIHNRSINQWVADAGN